MSNYEAIMQMDKEQMVRFLDQVYQTGLHNGTYAASLGEHSQEQLYLLDEGPYSDAWLEQPAEEALMLSADTDGVLPEALIKAILRNTGFDVEV